MIKNGGLYEADGKTMRPKIQTALTHAALSDVVIGLAGWSWWVRSARGDGNMGLMGTGKGMLGAGEEVTMTDMGVSALSLPILLYSANLGGTLVYNYGVGLSMGKRGKTN